MRLSIGGITPFTTIDFPGHLAAVVFLQGCNWRCVYCHNPHLQKTAQQQEQDGAALYRFLDSRHGLLEGVVFSGGEPLMQSGLYDAMRSVKGMGFKVALHTAGTSPRRLEKVLPLLDWVGLDIKAPFADYPRLTGVKGSGGKAYQCLEQILSSGVNYEVRTTVDPNWFTTTSLMTLAKTLAQKGVSHYALQQCRPVAGYSLNQADLLEDSALVAGISKLFPVFALRTS